MILRQAMAPTVYSPACMKKAPEGPGLRESGGGDFVFGAEPVFEFVAVFPAACYIKFIGTQSNLFFEILFRFVPHCGWWFLRGVYAHG
jgi:hypothetical protein